MTLFPTNKGFMSPLLDGASTDFEVGPSKFYVFRMKFCVVKDAVSFSPVVLYSGSLWYTLFIKFYQ
ncbi:hypothetical protein A8L34_10945 [Bacillus sp. FJAT-27264]|nr:hypothetical protein A8L34_10945 [Bacillus sp. FJAT-27264]